MSAPPPPTSTSDLLRMAAEARHGMVEATWLWVIVSGLLGAASGWLLDEHDKAKGGKLVWHWDKLVWYLVLGLVACIAIFIFLTEGRDPRATDFVWAGLSAMKGADILAALSAKIKDVVKKSG